MTDEETIDATKQTASRTKILIATLGALLVAVVGLFAVVLPAERGFDPLGTGKLLGLLALAQENPIAREVEEYKLDLIEIELLPTEWAEYIYRFDEGGSMLFSWQATSPVSYNFHSQPDGAPPGYAESFDSQESSEGHGTYTAPFSGIHGWYWENLGEEDLTVRITTAGFYLSAQESRDRVSGQRKLRDARGNLIEVE